MALHETSYKRPNTIFDMTLQFQSRLFLALACVLSFSPSLDASVVADGPVGGSPFMLATPLASLPSPESDSASAVMSVYRLGASSEGTSSGAEFSPHSCDMGEQADMKTCLGKSRGCMWTSATTRDPFKRVQAVSNYCLPCEIDGQDIPCWNIGAWVGGKQITDCRMSCGHQEKIYQPEYACSDDTGYISLSQCFDRAAQSGSKCMYIEYEDKGQSRASCAPCQLEGTGGWGCPAVGAEGPISGTKVKSCLSQCDVLCAGPPACPPTVAPPPPPPPQQSPGLPMVSSAEDEMLNAPAPWMAAPTINPYSIIEAAREAAKKAGFQIATTPPPPKVYWPVVYYRSPQDYLYTTGPPPVVGPEPPTNLLQTDNTRTDASSGGQLPRSRNLRHWHL